MNAAARVAETASTPKRSSIFLVDDHAFVREGLALVLNGESDLVVTGEAATAREALDAIISSKPDIVMLDLSLREGAGLELIKDLRARDLRVPILVLSMHDEAVYARRALCAGAQGYIMKTMPLEQIVLALRRVLRGDIYLSEQMATSLVQHLALGATDPNTSPTAVLNDRELEVFRLIGQGQGTREIARMLTLSPKTIAAYREKIKKKLNLKSGTALVRQAIQWTRSQANL
jgi:DNA-binding NarL/FixJ family response regulator